MSHAPPISRRAVRLAAILAVVAGLFVSGCGQTKAGAAALVGDQRIAIAELSASVNSAERALSQNGQRISDRGRLVRAVLSRQILSAVLEEAAHRKDITVTRGDVDEQISQLGGRRRLEVQALRFAVPPSGLRDFVRHQIMQQRIAESLGGANPQVQQAELVSYLHGVARDMGVTVSPRYGQFDMQRFGVTEKPSDLSTADPDSQGS